MSSQTDKCAEMNVKKYGLNFQEKPSQRNVPLCQTQIQNWYQTQESQLLTSTEKIQRKEWWKESCEELPGEKLGRGNYDIKDRL